MVLMFSPITIITSGFRLLPPSLEPYLDPGCTTSLWDSKFRSPNESSSWRDTGNLNNLNKNFRSRVCVSFSCAKIKLIDDGIRNIIKKKNDGFRGVVKMLLMSIIISIKKARTNGGKDSAKPMVVRSQGTHPEGQEVPSPEAIGQPMGGAPLNQSDNDNPQNERGRQRNVNVCGGGGEEGDEEGHG